MYKHLLVIWVVIAMLACPVVVNAQEFTPFGSDNSSQRESQYGVIATVDFVDTPITSVFRMISDLTGWSIVMSPEVSKTPPRINLWIKNMSPDAALGRVLDIAGLIMERDGNVINVMTFDEYSILRGLDKKVIHLKNALASDVARLLSPYVDKQSQARILTYDAGNAIVLLVPKTQMDSLVRLIKLIDSPSEYDRDTIRIIKLVNRDVSQLESKLEDFFTESSGVNNNSSQPGSATQVDQPDKKTAAGNAYNIKFMIEPAINVIVIRGDEDDIEDAVSLITKLDKPSNFEVISYCLRYTQADQLFQTLEDLIESSDLQPDSEDGDNSVRRLRIALSQQNNSIIVEGDEQSVKRVGKIIEAIDQPLPSGSGIIRLYRLENTTSDEVATILQTITEEDRDAAQADSSSQASGQASAGSAGAASGASSGQGGSDSVGSIDEPKIVSAPGINAVVIKAGANEHEQFAEIIKKLDSNKYQVVIEVTLVFVQKGDSFSFGLEAGGNASINDQNVNMVGFSKFGIGAIDAATGLVDLASNAPMGLNYAIMNLDDFSLVINALQTIGELRIVSSPKILTEDNSAGVVRQILQEPYEVTSQGETTTTTSFGGYVEAGTTLQVLPHISEKDWLRLEYNIQLSSFSSTRASTAVPPAISENTISGIARVPSGNMIVLGGIVGNDRSSNVSQIPILGSIPLLGELFKNRSTEDGSETLFVFVRPRILRDDNFDDMINISGPDVRSVMVDSQNYPVNPMLWLPEKDIQENAK